MYKPAKASALYYKINWKKQFLSKLNTGKKYDIIHISAHGGSEKKMGLGNGRTWLATPEEIEETNHKATLVFASACIASRQIMADAFHGAKFFLAPKTEIDWIAAATFSMLFYKRYIVDGIKMQSAFEYARNRTRTKTDYPNYWE